MSKTLFFCATVILLIATSTRAANKVVVVPLYREPSLQPFAPLADPDPAENNYIKDGLSVVDKKTGLIWKRYDSLTTESWKDAWSYCQSQTTSGWQNWRLPSIDELSSIVHFGTHSPAINSFVFEGTNSSCYWSATTDAGSVLDAWEVSFYGGRTTISDKSAPCYVRCVRGQSVLHNKFENSSDETVIDLATGLMWQRLDDSTKKHYSDADAYCNGLSLGGKKDWRLPNIKELQSIVEYRTDNPAIDFIPFPATKGSNYWSATSSSPAPFYKWVVNFNNGNTRDLEATNASYAIAYVRCVRSGQ